MNKKVKKVIEDLGWSFNSNTSITIQTTTAGQDVCIGCDKGESLKETIKFRYENYDIDQEVSLFLEAKKHGVKGVPEVTLLVKDCEEVLSKLKELWLAVKDLPNF